MALASLEEILHDRLLALHFLKKCFSWFKNPSHNLTGCNSADKIYTFTKGLKEVATLGSKGCFREYDRRVSGGKFSPK